MRQARFLQLPNWLAIYYVALVVSSILWPRYLFIQIAGVGLNPYTVGTVFATIVCFIVVCFGGELRHQWTAVFLKNYITWALIVAFCLWKLLCAAAGEKRDFSFNIATRDIAYTISHGFIASVFFLDWRTRKISILVLSTIILLASIIGVGEKLEEKNIADEYSFIDYAAGDIENILSIVGSKSRDGDFRAQSTFSHPIVFGQLVAAAIPLAFFMIESGVGFCKVLGIIQLLTAPLAIYSSGSRSPALVGVVSVLSWIILNQVEKKRIKSENAIQLIISAIIVSIVAIVFSESMGSIIGGGTNEEANSSAARVDMIYLGLNAVGISPIIGFGDGMAPFKAGLIGQNNILTIDSHYLSVLIDNGYVGIVVYIAILFGVIHTGYSAIKNSFAREDRRMVLALLALVFGILFGQLSISIIDNMTFVFMLFGFMAVVNTQTS